MAQRRVHFRLTPRRPAATAQPSVSRMMDPAAAAAWSGVFFAQPPGLFKLFMQPPSPCFHPLPLSQESLVSPDPASEFFPFFLRPPFSHRHLDHRLDCSFLTKHNPLPFRPSERFSLLTHQMYMSRFRPMSHRSRTCLPSSSPVS